MKESVVEKKDKNILLIAYYYPPLKSIGSMRSYFLSHTFLDFFNTVDVLSTRNVRVLEQDQLPIDERITVQHVTTLDYRTLTSIKSKKSHYSEKRKDSKIGQFVVKFLNSFPFNLLIGEGGLIYILCTYFRAVKMIRSNNIGYVYSSFRPYSDHFVAYMLKKTFPHLFWIADFRDIHIDVFKDNVFLHKFQRWCNKKILRKANLTTFVSKGCLDHFKHCNDNLYLLHNGIYTPFHNKEAFELAKKFTITYTGSLYGDKRDPSLLFTAIRELIDEGKIGTDDLEIIYAGKDSNTWQAWVDKANINEVSSVRGLIPLKDAMSLQKSSHINLLLTFSHPEVKGAITGKMFEYLSSKRLLLCIINGVKDEEVEEFVNSFSSGNTFYNEPSDLSKIKLYLQKKYLSHKNKQIEAFCHDKVLESVSWENMTSELMKQIYITENKNV